MAEILEKLSWDASEGGALWADRLPPVPDEPLEQAERVVQAVAEVGEVLAQLHQAGYVCAGFQPEAFMKTPEGIRVTDLQARVTRFGELPAVPSIAPAFSAPELVERSAPQISPATDVFHLGALFYALATRKFPEGTTQEGLRASRYRLPRFRIYDPTFPVGFEHLWRRATHVDHGRRYESIDQFIGALEQALESARRRAQGAVAMQFEVASRTEIGKVKGQLCPENQDRIYPDPDQGEDSRLPASGHDVLAIADGVSRCDYGSGALASNIVINWVKKAADQFERAVGPGPWDLGKLYAVLRKAVAQATKEISQSAPSGPNVNPNRLMSSTLVAAMIQGHQVLIGNTGNSKAYLASPEFFEQISLDDDVRHARLRSGIPPEQVDELKGNKSLRRVVGACAVQEGKVVPDLQRIRFTGYRAHLSPGDILLLCSDGLIEPNVYLEPEEAYQLITENRESPARELCDLLVDSANERQRPPSRGDNISAIVVKVLPT